MNIFEIKNAYHTIRFLDFGATIYEWITFSDKRNIILNNQDLEVYRGPRTGFFGGTLGRVANRIRDGHLEIDGVNYQLSRTFAGEHHGHGGSTGFSFMTFDVIKHTKTSIWFKVVSPDLHEGYPGEVTLTIKYTLRGRSFTVDYIATTTQKTPINITNHVHFNLSDEDTILNHTLKIQAQKYLETDAFGIPSGKYLNVKGTPLDFTKTKRIGDDIEDEILQKQTKGIDQTLIFKPESKHQIVLGYENRILEITTDYPSVQVYTMNYPLGQKLKNGSIVHKYQGVALECQFEPDAVHHDNFTNIVLSPEDIYHQKVVYKVKES